MCILMSIYMSTTPMPPHWFQILLSLAGEPRHGLGLTKDVFDRTDGQMHLWPGMLYGTLRKMEAAGLVAETSPPSGFESGGGKPKFHAITRAGRRACAEESERMARYVAEARARKLIGRRT